MLKEFDTSLNSFEVFSIFNDKDHIFFLDSSMDFENLGRYSFISFEPFDILKVKNDKNCLLALQERLDKYQIKNDTELPFIGGAVGYIAYDSFKYIENIKQTAKDDIGGYDLYFGFYDFVIVFDNFENKKYIATPNLDIKKETKVVEKIINEIKKSKKPTPLSNFEKTKTILKSNFTQKQYEKAVLKIKKYIEEGEVYQVNLTQRFEGTTNLDSFALYGNLREISPSTFGGFLGFDGFEILSNSPERFIKVVKNTIETRPIKGTRPRGKNKEEDIKIINELKNSEKDKSELLMIVDLERNDLSKICNKVYVEELFSIESYANVHHLVSSIKGELCKNTKTIDILKATFPGGSITGAPKLRSMEIIEELEKIKRNVYTGCIGYIGFCGNIDLNIAIRTIIKKNEKIYFQAGGAVTWDSDPIEEYEESLSKTRSIMKALEYENKN